MLSGKSKGFGFFTLFFIIWATVVAILDLYYYARQQRDNQPVSKGTAITMIILNAVTVVVGLILAIYAIWVLLTEWRHPGEVGHEMVAPAAYPSKGTSGLCGARPSCFPPAVKKPCAPLCPKADFNPAEFVNVVNKFKCYTEEMKECERDHKEKANLIQQELNAVRDQFKNVCRETGVEKEVLGMGPGVLERAPLARRVGLDRPVLERKSGLTGRDF